MKDASDRIIYSLLALLLIFGALSFFVQPAYEKGVWLVLGAIVSGLSGLFGFKFGVHIPKPDPAAAPPAIPNDQSKGTQTT